MPLQTGSANNKYQLVFLFGTGQHLSHFMQQQEMAPHTLSWKGGTPKLSVPRTFQEDVYK